MIYVVAGTVRFPFTRLLCTLNHQKQMGFIQEELSMQYGSFRPPFKLDQVEYKRPIFPYTEHLSLLKEARIVISEAGEDIVLLCLMMGKIPIVVPRRQIYGEQVDDHQVELAQRLEMSNRAIVVYEEEQLPSAIQLYEERANSCLIQQKHSLTVEEPKLHQELSSLLEEHLSKGLISIDMAT